MFDEPITTLAQAKEYFRAMGCSGFHMAREYPQRYEEYRRLGISRETEQEWRQERFDEVHAGFLYEIMDPDGLWNAHARMYDLFVDLWTRADLTKMLEATEAIRERTPRRDRVLVAETIVGRSARGGLIHAAYELGDLRAARRFAELALHFAEYYEGESRGLERCQAAAQVCNETRRELGI